MSRKFWFWFLLLSGYILFGAIFFFPYRWRALALSAFWLHWIMRNGLWDIPRAIRPVPGGPNVLVTPVAKANWQLRTVFQKLPGWPVWLVWVTTLVETGALLYVHVPHARFWVFILTSLGYAGALLLCRRMVWRNWEIPEAVWENLQTLYRSQWHLRGYTAGFFASGEWIVGFAAALFSVWFFTGWISSQAALGLSILAVVLLSAIVSFPKWSFTNVSMDWRYPLVQLVLWNQYGSPAILEREMEPEGAQLEIPG